jgi:hypothetical protein
MTYVLEVVSCESWGVVVYVVDVVPGRVDSYVVDIAPGGTSPDVTVYVLVIPGGRSVSEVTKRSCGMVVYVPGVACCSVEYIILSPGEVEE